MSSVDNRIVKMSMENGQFTSAANSTMNTLKQLGDSLKLTEGAKGLENITKQAKGVDLNGLAAGVEEVKNRFSLLDVVGVAALVNITNSAINAGKNMVKALTIDPIMDGFREYETKMSAIQTIMTNTSSKGTTMDEINGALQELNDYSDLTIYNFAQMTDNIGKATAAGVGLKDSVTFVKGLANVAAGFGVDATRMAGATYQMTQALSAGVIKLQDWKSLEQSGMGGQMLQDSLVQTAKEMGVFVDTSVPFRETLESNWLSSEVFIKTMDKMANDPSLVAAAQNVTSFTKLLDTMKESVGSGWAVSWEKIFGDKNQSTELFTNISNKFTDISGAMSDYRNQALEFWNVNEGRQSVLNGLANIAKVIGDVLGPLYESFKKIIDPWNGQRLVEISKGFQKMTESIKISDKTSALLSRTFDGVFSALSIVRKVVVGVIGVFASFTPLLSPIIDGFLSITAVIADYAVGLNNSLDSTNVFTGLLDILKNIVSSAANLIGNGLELIAGGFESLKGIDLSWIKMVGNTIKESFSPIEGIGLVIVTVLEAIGSHMRKSISVALEFGSKVWGVMSKISDAIINTLGGKGNALNNIVTGGLLATIALGIKKLIGFFKNLESDFGGVRGIVESVTGVFDGVKDSITSFQNGIKVNSLLKIAGAIGILAVSLVVIASIDSTKLVTSLATMGTMMAELVGSMVALEKLGGGTKLGLGIVVFASSILILSAAMKNLEQISWEDSAKGLLTIGSMMAMLVGVSKTMQKGSLGMIKSATAMVIFSSAINVLSKALKIIGDMDPKVITKGLMGIGILMAELSIFMKVTNLSGMSISKAAGVLIFAESLKVMGAAVATIGALDPDTIAKGLQAIGVMMIELSVFMNSLSGTKNMVSTATSIAILSGALFVLGNVIAQMGSLDPSVIGAGLLTIGGALILLSSGMKMMPKNMMGQAVSLVVIAGALFALSQVIKMMGGMTWYEIGSGLAVLAGSLTILAIAMHAMKGAILGSTSLLIMAGALAVLTPSLLLLGNMSLSSVGTSLLMLAGVFTVLGVSGLVLAPLTPVLLALSLAIGLLGVGCLAVGVGISAFAAGLGLLAVSGTAGAAALVVVISTLVGLIPMIATSIANGIVNIIKVLFDNTAIIAAALTNLVVTAVRSLTSAIPAIVDLISSIIVGVLDILIEATPKIVDAVVTVIMSVLEALTENIPTIASYVVESLLLLITNVLAELADSIPKIGYAITSIIVAILNTIGNNVPRVVNAAYDMIIKMINGLADAVETKGPEVRAAVKRLVESIITEFKNAIKDATDVGGNIMAGLKNGILNGIGAVQEAAKSAASSALTAAKKFLGIFSPSREFAKLGMYSDQGLAKGLDKHADVVEKSATNVADTALSSMRTAMSSISEVFNTDYDTQPRIQPVLDLSDIESGMDDMNGLFNRNRSVSLGLAGGVTDTMLRSIATSTTPNGQNDNSDVVSAIRDLEKTITDSPTSGYSVGNVTYDDGSNVASAVKSLVRATRIKRRS